VSRSILDFSRTTGQRRFGAKIRLRVPTSVLLGKQFSDALKLSVGIHFHDLPNGFGQRVDGPRGLGRQDHHRYPRPFPRGCSLTKLLSLTPLALQRNR
jgi:hypothetical protein